MKLFFLLFLSAAGLRAATIDITGTPYRFEYDEKAWDFYARGVPAKGLWTFADRLLFLGGNVICLDSGMEDGITVREMVMAMNEGYEKAEEMEPINGMKALKLHSADGKKARWVAYLGEAKFTLCICVEGNDPYIALRAPMVRAFLGGLKKRE